MKKKVFGRALKRDTNERKALFKGLMTELVLRESIKTTHQKAKAIKGQVEKLVTKAKVRGGQSRQFLQPYVSAQAVNKIIADLAVRFADRPGGYTRIVKLGSRFSDNADMAVIEWVEKTSALEVQNQQTPIAAKDSGKTTKMKSSTALSAKKATKMVRKTPAKTTKKDEKKETKKGKK